MGSICCIRLVNLWNSVPQKAVQSVSLNIFKMVTDRYLNGKVVQDGGRKQECHFEAKIGSAVK